MFDFQQVVLLECPIQNMDSLIRFLSPNNPHIKQKIIIIIIIIVVFFFFVVLLLFLSQQNFYQLQDFFFMVKGILI